MNIGIGLTFTGFSTHSLRNDARPSYVIHFQVDFNHIAQSILGFDCDYISSRPNQHSGNYGEVALIGTHIDNHITWPYEFSKHSHRIRLVRASAKKLHPKFVKGSTNNRVPSGRVTRVRQPCKSRIRRIGSAMNRGFKLHIHPYLSNSALRCCA